MSYLYSQKKKIMRRLNKFFKEKFGFSWRSERDIELTKEVEEDDKMSEVLSQD